MARLDTRESYQRIPTRSARSTLMMGGVIFAAAGVLMLVVFAFLVFDESRYHKEYELVEAEIVEIVTETNSDGTLSHHVFVSYEIGGQRYSYVPISFYDSSMKSGQIIRLFADPDDPTTTYMKRATIALVLIAVMGAVFTVAGAVSIRSSRNTKKSLFDREQGEKIYASVISAEKTHVRVNRRTTYQITARWTDPYGNSREFKSEYLYFDPSPYIKEGELIEVYVDPNNYSRYYMCAQELLSGGK